MSAVSTNDPRVVALAAAFVALLDGIAEAVPKKSWDELIPIEASALAEKKFEYRAIVRLVESGTLRTVKIGRRRYTKASWLAELADRLPLDVPAPAVLPAPRLSERDELIEMLQPRRGRRRHFVNGGFKT